jgi:hypothetical protein
MSLKKLLRENFEFLQSMSVPEYVLYRKFEEINIKDWTPEERSRMWEIKNSLWYPTHPDDYLKLQPGIIIPSTKEESLTWRLLRIFTSTMIWNQSPGRIIRAIIYDKATSSYLGVLSLASDFISLTPRDNHIGWTYDQRIKDKMLNYTAMGSSIIPTQPLGHGYTGGKLLALMICSDKVVEAWNKRYDKDFLAAITTTSLYGGFSQYSGLKYWKKCGSTSGKIPLEPSEIVYRKTKEWVKTKYPNDFKRLTAGGVSHPKSRMLSFIYSKLDVKPIMNNAPRGTYLCKLYTKSNEFLSMKSTDAGEPLFDNRAETLVDLWKEKYASKRIKNLLESKKFNPDALFYDNMIGKKWSEVKEMYLEDVGR